MLQAVYSIRQFYNHLILSGTKIESSESGSSSEFYNHLILSGTKIPVQLSHF